MPGIYILSDYGKLSKHSEHLVFDDGKGNVQKLLISDMEMLVLQGKISITADSFRLMAKNGLPVYIMENGAPNVSIDYGLSKNGFLRQNQYRIQSDAKKSLGIAKAIVQGKIKNQLTFLRRLERLGGLSLDRQIAGMDGYLKNASRCNNKEKLRGLEGCSARAYFDLFDLNIKPDWAVFGTRSRQPPKTNVNAALSYIYSLLECRVQCALEAVGLDTMCSNLHEMTYGKNSFVFDLMEEFRTPIGDALCCTVFNHGMISETDFCNANGGVYLTSDGCSKVINAFENKMKSEVLYEPEGETLSYLNIIFEQARAYKRFTLGQTDSYRPFAMR